MKNIDKITKSAPKTEVSYHYRGLVTSIKPVIYDNIKAKKYNVEYKVLTGFDPQTNEPEYNILNKEYGKYDYAHILLMTKSISDKEGGNDFVEMEKWKPTIKAIYFYCFFNGFSITKGGTDFSNQYFYIKKKNTSYTTYLEFELQVEKGFPLDEGVFMTVKAKRKEYARFQHNRSRVYNFYENVTTFVNETYQKFYNDFSLITPILEEPIFFTEPKQKLYDGDSIETYSGERPFYSGQYKGFLLYKDTQGNIYGSRHSYEQIGQKYYDRDFVIYRPHNWKDIYENALENYPKSKDLKEKVAYGQILKLKDGFILKEIRYDSSDFVNNMREKFFGWGMMKNPQKVEEETDLEYIGGNFQHYERGREEHRDNPNWKWI
tara:strand:+ start:662 stop:1789 length:1128 start_codon:yes stop_codon:yes gene_type:complete